MAGKSKSRSSARPAAQGEGGTQSHNSTWLGGVLLPALMSAIALWAAFAPLDLHLLAWIAPGGWLLIAHRKQPVGRAGYVSLWLSGCVFWLLILHGIRLAFWPLYFGWILLSLYLAVYVPLFVGITRSLHHRLRWPLVLAAPVAWVGMELARSYLLTGFAGNTLAHSQAHWPMVIQLADQLGTGGIGFVMIVVCCAILQLGLARSSSLAWRPALASTTTACVLVSSLLGYGWWKLREWDRLIANRPPLLRALLVQENTPTIFEYDPGKNQLAWTRYLNTTRDAVRKLGKPNVVIWPESTFTANEPLMEADLSGTVVPSDLAELGYDAAALHMRIGDMNRVIEFKIGSLLNASLGRAADESIANAVASEHAAHLLVGNDLMIYKTAGLERYNTALFIGPKGEVKDRYSKMHRVMVGEYMPLEPVFGWLSKLFGQGTIQAGQDPKSFPIYMPEGVVRLSPSICFESMVPQLISWQVRQLARSGQTPDVLVNISNDSWFRGSSALDHHLASSILTAVENRRPMLVAANTGITAEIESSGRVLQSTERMVAEAILAEPRRDSRWGLVQVWGYPLSWLCLILCCLSLLGLRQRALKT
ncbi:MAG: apolipoprotein N-acyltransferase [Pirellulaceae bacterium]